jgi:hypothetical protein
MPSELIVREFIVSELVEAELEPDEPLEACVLSSPCIICVRRFMTSLLSVGLALVMDAAEAGGALSAGAENGWAEDDEDDEDTPFSNVNAASA